MSTSELTLQLVNLLRNNLNSQTTQSNSDTLSIGLKLDGDNYQLWARLMRIAISGRGRVQHITGVPPPPAEIEPDFLKWEQSDLIVFSWLIQNIDPKLVNRVAEYPTAKALWDGLAITYGSGADSLQIYDLHIKANRQTQGQSTLEEYWNILQSIWMNIDRRQPNLMGCCEIGVTRYNKIVQEHRLYQFLSGLDDKYDSVRRDILKQESLPSVESAYATVRREAARLHIMKPATTDYAYPSSLGIGTGLVARITGDKPRNEIRQQTAKGRRSDNSGKPWKSSSREDKSNLQCTHCGMKKHIRETCFKLVGYPEWWEDNHKPPSNRAGNSKAAAAIGIPEVTDTSSGNGDGQQRRLDKFCSSG